MNYDEQTHYDKQTHDEEKFVRAFIKKYGNPENNKSKIHIDRRKYGIWRILYVQ
jgi:hypothetical protein